MNSPTPITPSPLDAIYTGVWRLRVGTPERFTPVAMRETPADDAGLARLPAVARSPIDAASLRASTQPRALTLTIPIDDTEQFFGFGLQLKSVAQRGTKKTLRVNSDPVADTGDSHAPVPFLVSTRGYGLLVDTARYVTFYTGSHIALDSGRAGSNDNASLGSYLQGDYAQHNAGRHAIVIDVPVASGVDVFVFGGPTLANAVQRYNLFSGGGCLPAMWGLGVWYRGFAEHTQQEILELARSFREAGIPLDVLGLEPGWQTRSYSCSYVWNTERFPDPQAMTSTLAEQGVKLNLWEHAFVHPSSPIYRDMLPHAGSVEVWQGLVPDFTRTDARKTFAEHHRRTLVSRGVPGFKLDECDNSDFLGRYPWSFPEYSTFPSGIDGEQMHSLFGTLYMRTMLDALRAENVRTYSSARSAHALASPFPFVMYSDLYDHADFIRGVVTAGFSGVLWSPEVRQCATVDELLRRLQSVVVSPQALINGWMIRNPPWLQVDRDKNNRGEFHENWRHVQERCKRVLQLRMRLLPYLYGAFARYRFEGLPPCRSLAMDHPEDAKTHTIADQFMVGADILAAPLVAPHTRRAVYLPTGEWRCFHTNSRFEGGKSHEIDADVDTLPLFVRGGAIVPLAEPVNAVRPDTVFKITAKVFASTTSDVRPTALFEDDGVTYDYERGAFNRVTLAWSRTAGGSVQREGTWPRKRYEIVAWDVIE